MHDVQVTQVAAIPLAVVRRQARPADLKRLVPEGCGIVWNAMRAQQVRAGRHVAIYWDDVMHVDIGVEVFTPFTDSGEVVQAATPAGSAAWTTHLGPYAGLMAANDAIRQWSRANKRTLAGPSWEIYGHWDQAWDADPSQIRTDVYYLLS